ncbi:hypothetical protein GCM10010964_35180 [Caldovatus sediminis]|uniref:Uncharacterized protein n=1 Tax=Caldovatus sediminis TaxID=2041189 RepID=A0A8J3EDI4_9PROT|nr:hypothetical protein [Caldovatus sediminis]GGG44763.1 hypothetical protein GCM10010964_35180 [Caldovatus sediminis]
MARLILRGAALMVLVIAMAFAGAFLALIQQSVSAEGRPDRAAAPPPAAMAQF